MKLIKKLFVVMLTLLSIGSLLAGCAGRAEPEVQLVESLNIKQSTVTLDLYEQVTLEYTLTNIEGTVTWQVADSSIATVNENGEVSAVANGSTVVTASLGEFSDTCTINVSSTGSVPSLSLDNNQIELALGKTFSLTGKVTYKGALCEGATYSYQILSGEQVVSVDEDGVISALSYGEAEVIVSASWHGVNGENAMSMQQSVKITVKAVVEFQLKQSEFTLYTVESLGANVYDNSAQLEISVYQDGIELDKEDIVWSTTDQLGIVSVQDDIVRGEKEGQTQVKYTASLSDGSTLEGYVSIDVKLPSIENLDVTVYLEKRELKIIDSNGAYSWAVKNNTLSAEEIFGVGTADVIEKILDVDGNVIGENSTITKIDTLSATPNSTIKIGVSNGKYVTIINAIVADHVIDSEIKLATHLPLIKDGYVILVKNLDFSEWKPWGNLYNEYIYQEGMYCAWRGKSYPKGKSVDANYAAVNTTPFTGHFNGQGYSIKNLSLGTSGLFGYIQDATIENLGFEPTKVYNTSIPTGLIARQANRSTLITIKNVYVKFDLKNKQSHADNGKLGIITGATNENILVQNCVFDIYDSGAAEQSVNNFGLVSVAFEFQHFKINNSYFVFNGDGQTTLKYQVSGVVNENINALLANKVFYTREACAEFIKNTEGSKDGFNACWKLDEDIPTFKN